MKDILALGHTPSRCPKGAASKAVNGTTFPLGGRAAALSTRR